jgi:hypothetical protein
LSLDLCGFVGITLSFSVHIFAFFVITCYLIADSLISTAVFILLYLPVFLLALVSLFMAWYVALIGSTIQWIMDLCFPEN